ncbi:MAG: phenylacetate--CoA ligase family protein, partial [Pyrinomonadaceae bacterium]
MVLQNLACTAEGRRQRKLRYGGDFHSLLDWLDQSQWWPAEAIEEYQRIQLRRLIEHAYQTVPYYRR